KAAANKSQSIESLKAEICPWEAPEAESTDKAEICPWEVAAASPAQPEAQQGSAGGSKGHKRIRRQEALASPGTAPGSRDTEDVWPWDSMDMEQLPGKGQAGSSALPKSASKKSQSLESLKAEICPWEVESTDKAEICPWESAAPPAKKEKAKQDKHGPEKSHTRSPALPKS
ncbi:GP179 protein, partial [Bucco capensis]|nr:GP179 protein [Bucco capensis]